MILAQAAGGITAMKEKNEYYKEQRRNKRKGDQRENFHSHDPYKRPPSNHYNNNSKLQGRQTNNRPKGTCNACGIATQLRGATAVGVLRSRCGIVDIPHLLPIRVVGDSSPTNTTIIRVGRWPTLTIKPEHLSRREIPKLTIGKHWA